MFPDGGDESFGEVGRHGLYPAQIQHKLLHPVSVSLFAPDKMDVLLLHRPAILAFEPLHRHLQYCLPRPYRHTQEPPDSATALDYMPTATFGTIKFVLHRFYFNPLVALTGAFLLPNTQGLIHEVGFHSVLYFAFTLRNASFFYCVSPTHMSEEPENFGKYGVDRTMNCLPSLYFNSFSASAAASNRGWVDTSLPTAWRIQFWGVRRPTG